MLCSYRELSRYKNACCYFSGSREELPLEELCGRAIELGLRVSFLDKQNIFDLFTLLTVVMCISSLFDRLQFASKLASIRFT